MNHNHGKTMTKLLAAALIAALLSPGLPVVHASNSFLREELLNRREEAAQNAASSNRNDAATKPTSSYDTAEEVLPPGVESPAKGPTAVTDREAYDTEDEEVAIDTPKGEIPGSSTTSPSGTSTPSSDSGKTDSGRTDSGKKDFVDLNGDGVDDSSPDDVDNRVSDKKEEPEPEKPDGTIVIPETQRPSLPSDGTSLGGFQYQGNSNPGGNTSSGNKDHISNAALDAVYRTQIQALSDALPEGTSLEVALKDAGPQYQKALQAAKMIAETENIKVFDINLKKEDGSNMHQLDDYVEVTMNIPKDYVIAEENTIVVHYLSEEGETEPCETVYHGEDPNNRYLTFKTDHFSVYFFMETSQKQAAEIYNSAGLTATVETIEAEESGSNSPLWIIIGAVAVVAIAGAGILLMKKKKK